MKDKRVGERLGRVAEAVRPLLREHDVEAVREYLAAGEWGLAHDHLCTQLVEYDAAVPRDVIAELAGLSDDMGLDPRAWQRLTAGD